MNRPELLLLAAMDRNRVIGRENALPWRLSDDLKLFKKNTLGHPILMGRKTWESIGRPLPGRRNLVLTRQKDFRAEGIEVVHSLEEALGNVQGSEKLCVIGGAEIYALCLKDADRLLLTHVDAEVEGGDAYFPAWDPAEFEVVSEQAFAESEGNEYAFRVVEYAAKHQNR